MSSEVRAGGGKATFSLFFSLSSFLSLFCSFVSFFLSFFLSFSFILFSHFNHPKTPKHDSGTASETRATEIGAITARNGPRPFDMTIMARARVRHVASHSDIVVRVALLSILLASRPSSSRRSNCLGHKGPGGRTAVQITSGQLAQQQACEVCIKASIRTEPENAEKAQSERVWSRRLSER